MKGRDVIIIFHKHPRWPMSGVILSPVSNANPHMGFDTGLSVTPLMGNLGCLAGHTGECPFHLCIIFSQVVGLRDELRCHWAHESLVWPQVIPLVIYYSGESLITRRPSSEMACIYRK